MDNTVLEILKNTKTIAVVGLSPKPDRASYGVSKYLQSKGYKIIPVYPREDEILGEKVYRNLKDINIEIDEVVIFRKSEEVVPVVEEALTIKPKYIWLQEGIVNDEAKHMAESAGIKFVMDKCMYKEYLKYREYIEKR